MGQDAAAGRPVAGSQPDLDHYLRQGRDAAARLAWQEAYHALAEVEPPEALAAADLELLATSAYLVGRVAECQQALERAHRAHADRGDRRRAARCLFWLGFTLFLAGQLGPAGGWLARAGRLLEPEPECGEHALLQLPAVLQSGAAGDHLAAQAAAGRAVAIAKRCGDPEALCLARHFQGRDLLQQGRIADGTALLDESMVAVLTGELAPYVAGNIYCSMIDACREIADLRRAREWTAALTTWCDRQPTMVTFSGQCLTHRAELLQLSGDWPAALAEARRACERFADAADQHAVGAAHYRLAELHRVRGEQSEAVEQYRHAGEWGHDPQPGLALLRLAAGGTAAARATIDRAVAEATGRARRGQLLPAQVEILLAAGDPPAARAAAEELTAIAEDYGTAALQAAAGHAGGAVLLAEGDAPGALVALRAAWQAWRELDAPYEAARVRVQIGLACRAAGDEEAAGLELDSARRGLVRLGAAPDLSRLDSLLRATAGAPNHGLSPRELQVLRLLATGATNHAIGTELVIAEKTVDRHVSNIFAKLGVTSRAAATGYAYRHQLV